jgi:uncharacterized membrane protein YuzA (DUF378 family)
MVYSGVKDFIGTIKPFVSWALDNLPRIIPIVAGIAGAFMLLNGVQSVIKGIQSAIGVLQFFLTAGPLGIAVLVVAALIAGFIILAQKVGGVDQALLVMKETIMNVGKYFTDWIFHPIQRLISDLFEILIGITSISKLIPGMGSMTEAQIRYLRDLQKRFAPDVMSVTEVFTKPYEDHKAEYERQKKEAGDDTESITSSIMGKFDEMIKAQMGTTAAVEGLADDGSSTSPAALRWGKLGQEDFWEIQRLGV